jgi:HSP20 family molecular chaperone IbpA
MPDSENPYDEMLKKIARMVEELLRNLPQEENARIIGCTIITNGGSPHFTRNPNSRSEENDIPIEIIDSPDMLFVTARLPSTLHTAPYADITAESLHIVVNERRIPVPVSCRIDVIHSFYQVRHGVLDIILKKKKVPPRSTPAESG